MPNANDETFGPTEDWLADGSRYTCRIDRGGRGNSGGIWDRTGTLRWRFGVSGDRPQRRVGNPFGKPDFAVADTDGVQTLVVRRLSFIPSTFCLEENGDRVGRIHLASLLRNRYVIAIDGVNTWTFRMPLFSVRFHAASGKRTVLQVLVGPSKMEWNILIRPGVQERQLVAALAFIHTEWWNYG